MFEECAPYRIRTNLTTGMQFIETNPVSWNNFSNFMILDLPAGTGFSYLRGEENKARTFSLDQSITDFVHFMKQFYEMHPQYKRREMYLGAQDFTAGQYLPMFAKALQDLKEDEFHDEDFDSRFMSHSQKMWDSWVNL